MYILKTEHSFDSAHFLAGYEGKCANIHGHRWRVEIEVQAEELVASGQLDGMVLQVVERGLISGERSIAGGQQRCPAPTPAKSA